MYSVDGSGMAGLQWVAAGGHQVPLGVLASPFQLVILIAGRPASLHPISPLSLSEQIPSAFQA